MTVHPSSIAAAFLSTGLISLAPNVLLFLFPNYAAHGLSETADGMVANSGQALLSLGQALAVGGLMGDVFLHTLPDCFADSIENHRDHDHHFVEGHVYHKHYAEHDDHQHHHGGDEIGLRVLLGFAVFLVMDILVRSLEDNYGGDVHIHSHSQPMNSLCNDYTTNCNGLKGEVGDRSNVSPWRKMLSSTVLLNLLGDSLHNFTDGAAIGVTFAASQIPPSLSSSPSHVSWITLAFSLLKSRGGLASASVFLHEIPHELGDFATLVKAGLSRNMAIGAQFLTAIAAFLGTALGLFSGQIVEGLGHDVLLPFIAGGNLTFFI